MIAPSVSVTEIGLVQQCDQTVQWPVSERAVHRTVVSEVCLLLFLQQVICFDTHRSYNMQDNYINLLTKIYSQPTHEIKNLGNKCEIKYTD